MLTVHLRINDAATGRPTPVRLRISGPGGATYPPFGQFAEFATGRNEDVGGHLRVGRTAWCYVGGSCEVRLPAGVPLRVQATKGPQYRALDETVTLGPGQMALRFTIARQTDTRSSGWVAVDTRCHFISPHAALLEAEAEDLDVVNLLAVYQPVASLDGTAYPAAPRLTAFSGQSPALERGGRAVVVNTLNVHPVLGKVALLHSHRPVFPLTFGGEETDDWSVCDWCDQCHRKGGLTVWVDAFEPAGGVVGGEALVAAVLGKIDAIEVTAAPRKLPLLPWVYRLWDAGLLIPLVGGSGKDSNRVALGSMRTYALPEAGRSWMDAVRDRCVLATTGPFVRVTRDGDGFATSPGYGGPEEGLELVANGAVIPEERSPGGAHARVTDPGWVAARCTGPDTFAHTSPIAVGQPTPRPEAVAALRKLVEDTRGWVEAAGRFENPKARQHLLDLCDQAMARLGPPP